MPYGWTLKSGSLPTGLTLNGLGVISGIPTVPGSSVFTVEVTDGAGTKAEKSLSLSVGL